MEPKKSDKANLEKKSPMFLSIGFLIALGTVLVAFEYKTKPDMDIVGCSFNTKEIEDPLIIPHTFNEPPPPPKPVVPRIIEVPEIEDIEDPDLVIDIETSEIDIIDIVTNVEEKKEEVVEDKVHDFVEEQANFPGGQTEWMKYLQKNMKYPSNARRMGIEGKVYVQFIIDKSGELSDIKVVKGIGGGCDEEALRVIQNAPKWNPGKQRGRAVKQRMTLPVFFQLQ
ncbi:energy transducer TonB [Marinigracilibium pacificum]|uniref:Energy transducer TonB n=1 Tax=Marinigracilibium pacificum TaxID=2729599 RepID=A0A848IWG1_9BACT|nr:energy transducer TonB [Marinigracilibium pacificum]NMM48667.1 energy transducer TonB [Marinigracilibium pacificum]